jgi:hypothetical protein
MISVESAALIAQVYPVAVLLLLLETGRIFKDLVMVGWFGRTYTLTSLAATFAAVMAGTASVVICLQAAVGNKPVEEWSSALVVATGWALFIATALMTGHIFGSNFLEWSGQATASKRAEAEAKKLAGLSSGQATPNAATAASHE